MNLFLRIPSCGGHLAAQAVSGHVQTYEYPTFSTVSEDERRGGLVREGWATRPRAFDAGPRSYGSVRLSLPQAPAALKRLATSSQSTTFHQAFR